MTGVFFELAIVILSAAFLGIAARALRQPILLAYLITGVLIGYFGFFNLNDRETFQIFSDLGIMFLLFLIGLEINYQVLKFVSKPALLVGLGQIAFTSLIGYGLAQLLGFGWLSAFYIAIALTFSSTVIVVKLLSEKRELNSLYGKISIGFLLVQDFIAILVLVLLAGIQTKGIVLGKDILITLGEGVFLFWVMFWAGIKILPKIFNQIARSNELLFLSSLGWVFIVVALTNKIGLSIEIGGFLAGLALANSAENFQIASRIRPLRDFFILIFFAILGSSLILTNFNGLIAPVVIFSLFVLIGNPLIVMVLMGFLGFRKRTSFFAGLTVAQISEFSLVLAALGWKVGHINDQVLALITGVGIVTITISSYFIIYAHKLYEWLKPGLGIFEKAKPLFEKSLTVPVEIVLIGCHRTGQDIAVHLPKEKTLIIDFDPEIIETLKNEGYQTLYGDATDVELFEQIDLSKTKLIISTVPDLNDNLTLVSYFRQQFKKQMKLIIRTENESDVDILYHWGADYVFVPERLAGHYLGRLITKGDFKGRNI